MTTATPNRSYLNRKQRELNKARGIPNRVDATLARTHLAKLRHTMGWVHLAAATECSACHLREIVTGRRKTINRVTHLKILAVQPAPERDAGFYIDATGTRRRIHAMQAIGHSQHVIAAAADTTQHRISVVSLGAARVRQKLADKIADAYEQLAHQTPPDNHFTRRCRNTAATKGWMDVAFWDDVDRIDDPDFDPASLTEPPAFMRIGEDALWLREQGYTRVQLADRLGLTLDYIDKSIQRYQAAIEQAADKQVAA